MQLKSRLKKDDLVVCIFHDHGSRYVGKVYNDQWMLERGFIEIKTFRDIINGRNGNALVTINASQTVADAFELMKKFDIENIPVLNDGDIEGAVSETGLFNKIFDNPGLKLEKISAIMDKPYPLVPYDTPVERLVKLINKENGAILSRDETGDLHIITKYDVIQALTKL